MALGLSVPKRNGAPNREGVYGAWMHSGKRDFMNIVQPMPLNGQVGRGQPVRLFATGAMTERSHLKVANQPANRAIKGKRGRRAGRLQEPSPSSSTSFAGKEIATQAGPDPWHGTRGPWHGTQGSSRQGYPIVRDSQDLSDIQNKTLRRLPKKTGGHPLSRKGRSTVLDLPRKRDGRKSPGQVAELLQSHLQVHTKDQMEEEQELEDIFLYGGKELNMVRLKTVSQILGRTKSIPLHQELGEHLKEVRETEARQANQASIKGREKGLRARKEVPDYSDAQHFSVAQNAYKSFKPNDRPQPIMASGIAAPAEEIVVEEEAAFKTDSINRSFVDYSQVSLSAAAEVVAAATHQAYTEPLLAHPPTMPTMNHGGLPEQTTPSPMFNPRRPGRIFKSKVPEWWMEPSVDVLDPFPDVMQAYHRPVPPQQSSDRKSVV